MSSTPSPEAGSSNSRRKKPRYAVSPDFRLNAVLALCGEGTGSSSGVWKDWPATLVDLSASGAHVQINLAALAYPDNPCRLKLSKGAFKLEVPGIVAHYVCSARYSVCGLKFDFSYGGAEKAYRRVFDPVMVSASLVAGESGTDGSGRILESYPGKEIGKLTVWRDQTDKTLVGFDFELGRFRVDATNLGGDATSVRSAMRFKQASGESLTTAEEAEAKLTFSVAASNLPKAVPADVRKFLLSYS